MSSFLVVIKSKVTLFRIEFIVMHITLAIDTIMNFVKEYVVESGADTPPLIEPPGYINTGVMAGNNREELGEPPRCTWRNPRDALGEMKSAMPLLQRERYSWC